MDSSVNDRPRGNLRLFFGGSEGLNAISVMERAARTARSAGAEIIVGFMVSEDRPGVDQLLAEFRQVRPLRREFGSAPDHRIDFKRILAGDPDVVLIDTRIPAIESNRRIRAMTLKRIWWDVERLLAAGVDVWASLDASGLRSWTMCPERAPLHRWVALPRALYSDQGPG